MLQGKSNERVSKEILAHGRKEIIFCDGKCNKAWGISKRPRFKLNKKDPDDIVFLADDELGEAPEDPGTYEGGYGKPSHASDRLNKWCYRECERCSRVLPGDFNEQAPMKDFDRRVYNKPRTA